VGSFSLEDIGVRIGGKAAQKNRVVLAAHNAGQQAPGVSKVLGEGESAKTPAERSKENHPVT
jgi:hypothetical protein